MPYIGKSPQHGNYSKIDDISSGFDGSDATHAIASNSVAITPVRPEALIISMNGVIQEPVTDYTVSGTDITFTTAPASGDSFFGVVMGEQLAIGTPSDATVTSAKLSGNLVTPGTLDVNGQELILDADGDTSITADTDDQIDIRIAGADDFQFTANTFTVLSGSTLTVASGATITNNGTANGFGALAGIDDQSSSNDDQITISDTAVIINEDSDDLDFRVESNGNANMLFVNGGGDRVGIGSDPDLGAALHVKSADSGASAHADADEIVIEGSAASGLSILSANDNSGSIYWADDGSTFAAYQIFSHSTNIMSWGMASTNPIFQFDANGLTAIRDSANAGMTTGLTINQQGADNEAIALKSSDVSHGATDFGETDTYGLFQKVSSSDGGLMLRGFSDGAVGMELRAMNTTNDTSDSSGSVGTMTLRSSIKTSGNTNDTNVGSTGNLIVFRDLTSTRVVIKGDGTVHAQDTSWATSLDTEDDMLALRMLDKAQSTKGVIDSAWDSMIGTDWKYLQKIGVAGSDHPEKGHPDMFSMQGIQKLTMGATWYLGQNFMAFLETIEKRMPGIRKEFEDHMLEQSGRPAMLTQTTT